MERGNRRIVGLAGQRTMDRTTSSSGSAATAAAPNSSWRSDGAVLTLVDEALLDERRRDRVLEALG